METKVCRKCGEELNLFQFHIKSDGEKGRNNICRDCIRRQRGQTKRMPPKPLPIQTMTGEITYEVLIEDVHEEARRHPRDIELREASQHLKDNPDVQHSEYLATLLYEMWERRMRHMIDFTELDQTCPVMNKHTEHKRQRRNTSINPFMEYESI